MLSLGKAASNESGDSEVKHGKRSLKVKTTLPT